MSAPFAERPRQIHGITGTAQNRPRGLTEAQQEAGVRYVPEDETSFAQQAVENVLEVARDVDNRIQSAMRVERELRLRIANLHKAATELEERNSSLSDRLAELEAWAASSIGNRKSAFQMREDSGG